MDHPASRGFLDRVCGERFFQLASAHDGTAHKFAEIGVDRNKPADLIDGVQNRGMVPLAEYLAYLRRREVRHMPGDKHGDLPGADIFPHATLADQVSPRHAEYVRHDVLYRGRGDHRPRVSE